MQDNLEDVQSVKVMPQLKMTRNRSERARMHTGVDSLSSDSVKLTRQQELNRWYQDGCARGVPIALQPNVCGVSTVLTGLMSCRSARLSR